MICSSASKGVWPIAATAACRCAVALFGVPRVRPPVFKPFICLSLLLSRYYNRLPVGASMLLMCQGCTLEIAQTPDRSKPRACISRVLTMFNHRASWWSVMSAHHCNAASVAMACTISAGGVGELHQARAQEGCRRRVRQRVTSNSAALLPTRHRWRTGPSAASYPRSVASTGAG